MEIKKIIHYCWFGGNPLPELAKKCIASWQKFLPNYEIKRWDETNFDINACAYVQEAYKAKRWAFVSDYARFAILYKYGGLYFDTDVEIIKPLDNILSKGGFMALESDAPKISVAPGLGLAAKPGLKLYKDILDSYQKLHFINSDGSQNVTTIVKYTTEILKKYGLKNISGIQELDGIYIYPREYFCPKDYTTGVLNITPQTVAIHHYTATWHSPREAYAYKLLQRLAKFLPNELASKIAFVISKIKYEGVLSLYSHIKRKK